MKKNFSLLLFILSVWLVLGQTFNIKGKIVSVSDDPIENATIYLIKQKDSSIINYVASSKQGNFTLSLKGTSEPMYFEINADKYAKYSKVLSGVRDRKSVV